MLRMIDVASPFQSSIDLARVDCDVVMVKASQGTNYVNPRAEEWADKTLTSGKLLGFYHYATGAGGAAAEVAHFLDVVRPYIGRAVLCLDWETQENKIGRNQAFTQPGYAVEFLRILREVSGSVPLVYMNKFTAQNYAAAWRPIADEIPLWGAQYGSMKRKGWETDPWTDGKPWGPWEKVTAHQYTSAGEISGYASNLDLSLVYLDRVDWEKWAAGKSDPLGAGPQGPAVDLAGLPMVRVGSWGDGVKRLQQRLNELGVVDNSGRRLAEDGIFGRRTQQAVLRFQRDRGLVADGIVGPLTWAALYE